jgi:hypothetical protein
MEQYIIDWIIGISLMLLMICFFASLTRRITLKCFFLGHKFVRRIWRILDNGNEMTELICLRCKYSPTWDW